MRRRYRVTGRVQGVGFRPFVARLAAALHLAGEVGNDQAGVWILAQGADLDAFERRLRAEAPPLARITAITASDEPEQPVTGFAIVASDAAGQPTLAIPPDAAVCAACAAEVLDPADRRFGYAFTSCTDCGPRYSIITGVPYDRPRTTMAGFAMCPRCQAEYDDPTGRRFHAQPNACPACGPRLRLIGADGDPLAGAARLLHQGAIVAVQGLGGVHLAVRADDDAAVRRLRERKGRDGKPFAVMVRDLATAQALVELTPDDVARLVSPAAPIVLASRRADAPVAAAVAPGQPRLGVLLPYTPLHLLLLRQGPAAVVLTSGNPSGEPLCHEPAEAERRLAGIADAFLLHDRPIAHPLDDSVWLGATPVRRARGHVPDPIAIPAAPPLVAVGGDLKAAVALAEGGRCILSEHLGDLAHPAALRHLPAAVARLQALVQIQPRLVVVDRHPGYLGARWARGLGLPVVAVQHHHAHAAACLAEHGHPGPAWAVVCDGTGYGDDGTVWGGEVLHLEGADCTRVGHLPPLRLLGGDAGAEDTWRPAAGILHAVWGDDWLRHLPRPLPGGAVVARQLAAGRGIACTSLGRWFDGLAWLTGLCDGNTFEGEAAIAVEAAAMAGRPQPARPLIDLVRALPELTPADAALAFHAAVCDHLAALVPPRTTVALSGGCFVNRLLLAGMRARLTAQGCTVLEHQVVPPGDGGLALGQAWLAACGARSR
jgi:hydrogenase maturation protein HypF